MSLIPRRKPETSQLFVLFEILVDGKSEETEQCAFLLILFLKLLPMVRHFAVHITRTQVIGSSRNASASFYSHVRTLTQEVNVL